MIKVVDDSLKKPITDCPVNVNLVAENYPVILLSKVYPPQPTTKAVTEKEIF
jgi:hypothetical protein